MFRSKRGLSCRNIRDMLSEYIDKRLDNEKTSLVERHLQTCEACSRELESLKTTVQLLRRMPEISVPHSFKIPATEPSRGRVFATASLRWLRPATAIVAIALVVLLAGDFTSAFVSGVNRGTDNRSLAGAQLEPTPVPIEMRIMVAVPGVMGQMALGTAQAVGYANYTVVYSPPADEIATVPGKEGQTGTQGIFQVNTRVGWPLRQIEIGLGAVAVILIALIIVARQRSRKVTVR